MVAMEERLSAEMEVHGGDLFTLVAGARWADVPGDAPEFEATC